jgi:hypothetical protein
MVGSWNQAHHPKLTDTNCIVTSPATKSYNCIAWAVTGSSDAPWWWPLPAAYYWPNGVVREVTIAAFLQAFATEGFAECADGNTEDGFEKIALYGNRMPWGTVEPTHAARQLPDGKWTSKLGNLEDIIHETAEDVNGPIYGGVIHYLKRPIR